MANIHVTYEQLDDASQRLRAGQDELERTLARLRTLVSELVANGFTTTRASGAFDQASQDFTTGATQTVQGLERMANFLVMTRETLRGTDEQLARAIQSS